ncbi:MAG TPA: alpha/beta hydrolase [Fulvivirga sp.]|nr:alpha/beta hydrolase [Fulvivirga sp.]
MKIISISLVLLYSTLNVFSQEEIKLSSTDVDLYATLLLPEKETQKVILIISGSGATDRDGNSKPGYVHDGLKKLAEELTELGYATLRYDKRGVGKSVSNSLKAENLRFEQYVFDAGNWISFLNERFEDITVIGHSQGALVGMLAIQNVRVNKFISLAGLSEDASTTIKRQLSSQPKFVLEQAIPILDSLNKGIKVDSVPQYMNSLFNPKIQNYLISFMKYDPREEIKKIGIPILVVQGTTDIQITVEGATSMSNNSPYATLRLIDGMNHVLRSSSLDINENMATYSSTENPLHKDLVKVIANFIGQ